MALIVTAALTFTPTTTVTGCPEIVARWCPPPPPLPTPSSTGVERWRALVDHYWDPPHVDRMLRIAKCESNGDPGAVNPRSGATGIFQVMPFWKKVWPGDYKDPWTNAAVAYQIWLTQGYAAWVCRG